MIDFRKLLVAACVLVAAMSIGCTSTGDSTSDEESMMNIEEGSTSEETGSLEDELESADTDSGAESDEDEDLFGEDEGFSDEESVADGGGSDSAEDDDFSDFDEESFDEDSFGEEETVAQNGVDDELEPLDEDPFADDALEAETNEEFIEEPPPQDELVANDSFEEPLDPAPTGMGDLGAPSDISNIKFLANESGGSVVIEANNPMSHSTRINPETSQFIIEIENSNLPNKLKRPYILKEFPTSAFGAINSYQDQGSPTVRVVIQMKAQDFAEPTVQAEGNSLIVIPAAAGASLPMADAETIPDEMVEEASLAEQEIEDAEVEEIAGAESLEEQTSAYDVASAAADEKALGSKTLDEFLAGNNKFYGRPISIQVKDADIRDVLSFIAGESGINMIISEGVGGTITLKLREIPWDQALVTVMKSKSLGYIREGSVVRINTLQNLEQEAENSRRILDAQKRLTPLRVKVLPVSFASVDELIEQIRPFLTKGRGNIVADPRTSSLIITDTDQVLGRVEKLVEKLDVAPAQVVIEGKIVEAVESFQKSLGVNWTSSGSTVELSDRGGRNNGPINLSQNLSVATLANNQAGNFNFDMQVGTLEFFGNLTAQLRIAESDSLANVISSPRVVTMNRQTAIISQDSESLSISTTISEGVVTRSVNRTPVVVKLEVTPQVTAEGSVIMDVKVDRQFAGPLEDQQTLARAVNKRQAKTRVLIKSGSTAVIGGMYNSTESNAEAGVPLLRKIPVVGWLFKSRTSEINKNELLVFLTPRILNLQDQGDAGEAIQ